MHIAVFKKVLKSLKLKATITIYLTLLEQIKHNFKLHLEKKNHKHFN